MAQGIQDHHFQRHSSLTKNVHVPVYLKTASAPPSAEPWAITLPHTTTELVLLSHIFMPVSTIADTETKECQQSSHAAFLVCLH